MFTDNKQLFNKINEFSEVFIKICNKKLRDKNCLELLKKLASCNEISDSKYCFITQSFSCKQIIIQSLFLYFRWKIFSYFSFDTWNFNSHI